MKPRKITRKSTKRQTKVFESADDYKKLAEKIQFFNQSVKSFQRTKEERKNEDYNIMSDALIRIPFLVENASPGSLDIFLRNCADMMEYEYIPKGSAVCHLGTSAKKFYIILKGAVDIYIPKSNEELAKEVEEIQREAQQCSGENNTTNTLEDTSEAEEFKQEIQRMKQELADATGAKMARKSTILGGPRGARRTKTINFANVEKLQVNTQKLMKLSAMSKGFQANNILIELFSEFPDYIDMYVQDGIARFKKIRTMGAGSYFGEIALSTDKPRTASVISSEDTHLISLTKSNYRAIFDASIRNLAKKASFFATFFSNCGKELISKFSYVFQERMYNYGQIFYMEGEPLNGVFLIKSGQVQLSCVRPDESKLKRDAKGNIIGSKTAESLNRFSKSTKILHKVVKVCTLAEGSIFGEEEILQKCNRSMTATATVDTVVYFTRIEEFERLMTRHIEFTEKIVEKYQTKEQYRQNRIGELKNLDLKMKLQLQKLSTQRNNKPQDFKLRNEIFQQLEEMGSSTQALSVIKTIPSQKSDEESGLSPRIERTPVIVEPSNELPLIGRMEHHEVFPTRYATENLRQPDVSMTNHPSAPVLAEGDNAYLGRGKPIRGNSNNDSGLKTFFVNKIMKMTMSDMVERNEEYYKTSQESKIDLHSWFRGDRNLHRPQPLKRSETAIEGLKRNPSIQTKEQKLPASSDENTQSPIAISPRRPIEKAMELKPLRIQAPKIESNRSQPLVKASNVDPLADRLSVRGSTYRSNQADVESYERQITSLTGRNVRLQSANLKVEVASSIDSEGNPNDSGIRLCSEPLVEVSPSDQINKEDLIHLELGAPWSKKRDSHQLSMHHLKPYYLGDISSYNVTRQQSVPTIMSMTTQHAKSSGFLKQEESPKSAKLNIDRVNSLSSPRTVLKSKHNMFRTKPTRPHLVTMYYKGSNNGKSK